MNDLTAEQQKQKSRIRTGALMSAALVAIVAAIVAFFATDAVAPALRVVVMLAAAGGLGWLAFRTAYNAGVAKAVCRKCGTAFAIREVDRTERVLGLEQRREIETLKPATEERPGLNRVTTWTEEKVEVTAIDECMNCHDRNSRTWTMTRDKDKVEQELPA